MFLLLILCLFSYSILNIYGMENLIDWPFFDEDDELLRVSNVYGWWDAQYQQCIVLGKNNKKYIFFLILILFF